MTTSKPSAAGLLRLTNTDNVSIAIRALSKGEPVSVADTVIIIQDKSLCGLDGEGAVAMTTLLDVTKKNGYKTDVRGILADRRESLGLPRDPLAAFARSGYLAKTAAERVSGTQASWGA